jgi:hypothetical protein
LYLLTGTPAPRSQLRLLCVARFDVTLPVHAGTYDAQNLVNQYAAEVGIEILGFKDLAYVPAIDQYVPVDQVPKGEKTLSISGTKFRKMMNAGEEIPEWFSHPDVIKILRVSGCWVPLDASAMRCLDTRCPRYLPLLHGHSSTRARVVVTTSCVLVDSWFALQEVSPPLDKRGFAVFFTGLSGSGKTTITSALIEALQSLLPTRRMTILDGDVVRTHLSAGLGFSIPVRIPALHRTVLRYTLMPVCSHKSFAPILVQSL